MVIVGLGLLGYALFGLASPAPAAGVGEGALDPMPDAPDEKMLKLTIPEMKPLKPPAPPSYPSPFSLQCCGKGRRPRACAQG
jgi:hypothetical protein